MKGHLLYSSLDRGALAAGVFLGSLLLGLLIDLVLRKTIRRLCRIRHWKDEEILLGSIGRKVPFWFSLAGLYGALSLSSLSPHLFRLAERVVVSLLILSFTFALSSLTNRFVRRFTAPSQGLVPTTSLISNLSGATVIVLGALGVLQYWGVSVTPVLTGLGIGALAVALALQDTLSNFFSGLSTILSEQIKPKDVVKLETGEEGEVQDINWRNTTLKTAAGNLVVVPNSKVAGSILTNFSLPSPPLTVSITLLVAFQSDLDRVESIILEGFDALRCRLPGVFTGDPGTVRFQDFREGAVPVKLFVTVQDYNQQFLVKHLLIKELHRRLKEAGVPFPPPPLGGKGGEPPSSF